MPDPDVFEAIDAGDIDVAIGGCVISDEDPNYRCSACGTSFARASRSNKPGDDELSNVAEERR